MFLSLPTLESRLNLSKKRYFPKEEGWSEKSFFQPTADIYEEKDKFIIKVSLPGLDKKDVQVEVEDNQLIVKGERKQEIQEQDDYYSRVESYFGAFERRWDLGKNIDGDSIEANHSNGILTLRVKKTENSQKKQIPISEE